MSRVSSFTHPVPGAWLFEVSTVGTRPADRGGSRGERVVCVTKVYVLFGAAFVWFCPFGRFVFVPFFVGGAGFTRTHVLHVNALLPFWW